MEVKLGFSQVNITPPIKTLLAGYAHYRESKGIHDDLFARILLIDSNKELLCYIQMDLICIENYFIDRIYEEIKEFGIKKNNLIIGATHTHSGPMGIVDNINGVTKGLESIFGDYNEYLVKNYIEKIVLGIKDALNNKEYCEIEVSVSTVSGVGCERHDQNLPYDNELFVLNFIRKDGKKILLYNFSCHPTIMNLENLLISNDLPYGVERHFKETHDMIIFINGAAGDISTRFTRKESTFEEVYRLGEILADAIKKSLKKPIYKGSIKNISSKKYTISLEYRNIDSVNDAHKAVYELDKKVKEARSHGISDSEIRLIESLYEGACTNLKFSKAFPRGKDLLDIEIAIIKINDWNLIAIPGELFSTLGNRIKEKGKNIIMGYTNGYYLYIADKEAYDKNYYEASSSYIKKGEGEKLVSYILERLKNEFK